MRETRESQQAGKGLRHPGFLMRAGLLAAIVALVTGMGLVSTPWAETASPTDGAPGGESASEARTIFAGGCFWCSEADFEKIDGVVRVRSGYTGGKEVNPTYKQVASGRTGHTEAVEIVYDPDRISYEELLDVYWLSIDPTVEDRQFCDVGAQYRTAIFVADDKEKKLAEASRDIVRRKLDKPIFTEIQTAGTFYPAEDYHQDYYKKNPLRYKYYRFNCGRDKRLAEIWKGTAKP